MKKIIALLLVACTCLSLCTCSSKTEPATEPTQTEPTQPPVRFEDRLIENFKHGDKIEKVEQFLGKPIDIHEFSDGDFLYTYEKVSIFDCKFTPKVYTYKSSLDGSLLIDKYEYEYSSGSKATSKVLLKELIDNFTKLYGEPDITEDTTEYYRWYFKNGFEILLFMGSGYPYTVHIEYQRSF